MSSSKAKMLGVLHEPLQGAQKMIASGPVNSSVQCPRQQMHWCCHTVATCSVLKFFGLRGLTFVMCRRLCTMPPKWWGSTECTHGKRGWCWGVLLARTNVDMQPAEGLGCAD